MVGAQSRPGRMREREIFCPYLALNHDFWLSIPWPSYYTDYRKQRRSKLGHLLRLCNPENGVIKLLRNVDPDHSVFGGMCFRNGNAQDQLLTGTQRVVLLAADMFKGMTSVA
jgi:hypothetical protein